MYNRILIATDGSELAALAVDQGLELARNLGSTAIAVTVTEPWSALEIAGAAEGGALEAIKAHEDAAAASARAILDSVYERADKIGVECKTLHVTDGTPAEGILEVAKAEGCDLIVMASHGRRGIGRMFLGSQTSEVLAHSKIPVLVLR